MSSDTDKKIPVMELFGPVLQGEGALIGRQTMFLRLGGCDYRCQMCDSLHAVLPELIKKGAKYLTEDEIVERVTCHEGARCKFLTLSGGNPCIWPIDELVGELRYEHDFKLAVETQGTIYQKWLSDCHYVTVSPKGPGMGEKFDTSVFETFLHSARADNYVNIKVVVFDQRDIEFAKYFATEYHEFPLWLSLGNPFPPSLNPSGALPMHQGELQLLLLDRMRQLYDQIKQEPLLDSARFTPQMHVLLYGNERGR